MLFAGTTTAVAYLAYEAVRFTVTTNTQAFIHVRSEELEAKMLQFKHQQAFEQAKLDERANETRLKIKQQEVDALEFEADRAAAAAALRACSFGCAILASLWGVYAVLKKN
ncbi:MAG: hypothetical protein WC700_04360 [Gemmatimonadaceae bacterium]